MHGVMQASPLVARTVRLDVRRRPVSIFDAFPPALIRVALLRNGALGKRARRAIRAAPRANVWVEVSCQNFLNVTLYVLLGKFVENVD